MMKWKAEQDYFWIIQIINLWMILIKIIKFLAIKYHIYTLYEAGSQKACHNSTYPLQK